MMNFRSVKTKQEKRKKGAMIFVIVMLIVLGFGGGIVFLARGVSPLGASLWGVQSDSLETVFQSKSSLLKEIETLRAENTQLANQLLMAGVYTTKRELEQKRSIFFGDSLVAVAPVLVRPNSTLYHSLVVGKGERDGVRVGDIVVGGGAVALGRVVEVYPSISHVELFTKNDTMTTLLHVASGTFVEARGQGGAFAIFTVSREVVVEEGDIVTFPHTQELLFGVVEKVDFEVTDPEKKVYVRSGATLRQLPYVEIIRGYEEQF